MGGGRGASFCLEEELGWPHPAESARSRKYSAKYYQCQQLNTVFTWFLLRPDDSSSAYPKFIHCPKKQYRMDSSASRRKEWNNKRIFLFSRPRRGNRLHITLNKWNSFPHGAISIGPQLNASCCLVDWLYYQVQNMYYPCGIYTKKLTTINLKVL